VSNDEKTKVILEAKVTDGRGYFRQSGKLFKALEKIIAWKFKDSDKSVALSFKSREAAEEMWQKINALAEGNTEPEDYGKDVDCVLDKTEFENLPRIAEKINASVFPLARRSKVIQQLLKDEVRSLIIIG
jgi:hypothetical protein